MMKYEKLVSEGELPPLDGMEILLIQDVVYSIINGKELLDDTFANTINSLFLEIEYVFKDSPKTLERLNEMLEPFNREVEK